MAQPRIPTGTDYFTLYKKAAAQLPPDVRGARVKFRAGKGYYISTGGAGSGLAKAAAAPPYQYPAAPSGDPFAPVSPQDITSIVNHFTGMLGSPVPDSKIAAQAQSEIAPYITQLSGDTAKQAAAAAAQIRGLTDSYAALLGQTNYAAPYQAAETQQAAADAALQQALDRTGGTDLASGLSSKLAALNDPSVAQAATGLADRGQAIGTTQLASGTAALSNLIANAAAAGEYGVKQPGIARNSGIQALGQSEAQHEHDLTTGVQQAESQLPSIIQALRSDNTSLRGNQANLASSLYQALTGQNITKATAKAGLVNDVNQINATNGRTAAEITAANQRAANAARTKANTVDTALSKTLGVLVNSQGDPIMKGGQIVAVPTAAGSTKPKANASLSKSLGYVVDSSGEPILNNGKKIKLPKSATPAGNKGPLGLSAKDYQKYTSLALGAARNYHSTWQDKNGSDQQPLTWQQYLTHGESAGIPIAILIAQGKKVYTPRERKLGLVPGGSGG